VIIDVDLKMETKEELDYYLLAMGVLTVPANVALVRQLCQQGLGLGRALVFQVQHGAAHVKRAREAFQHPFFFAFYVHLSTCK